MHNPLVSIIIPVYNVSGYIVRCIDSVISQTYTNIECIFIEDCSPDNSIELVEQKISIYDGFIRFEIIKHKHNEGVAEARNTGIKNAKGDYLYFLDGDDELTEDCIDTLVKMCRNQEDMIIGNYYTSGSEVLGTKLTLGKGLYSNKKIFHAYINREWYDMPWNKLIQRKFILENDLFFFRNLTTNQDALWSFQVATKLKSLNVTDRETYIYHVRNGSISTTPKLKKAENQLFILNEITNISLDLPYNVSNFIAAFAINVIDVIYYKTLVPLSKKELFYSYIIRIKTIIDRYPFHDLDENIRKGLSLIKHPFLCNMYCKYKHYKVVSVFFHRILFKYYLD